MYKQLAVTVAQVIQSNDLCKDQGMRSTKFILNSYVPCMIHPKCDVGSFATEATQADYYMYVHGYRIVQLQCS